MTDQTAPAPTTAAHPQATTSEEGPSLLTTLEDLGGTLVQSEIPNGSRLQQIVGAVVKVLDHAGVTVADELYPQEEEPVTRPETAQAQHQAKTETRLDRIESALERVLNALEGKDEPATDSTSSSSEPNPAPSSTAGQEEAQQ